MSGLNRTAAWHGAGLAEVCARLGASPVGLASAEAARRLAEHGPNALPEPPGASFLLVFLGQFRSPLIYLLLAGALASLWLRAWDEAGFILLVLVINSAIGAMQEWRAKRQKAALRSQLVGSSRVRRDGVSMRIPSAGLVPGDLALLEAGEHVPADIRLLRAVDLQADESALTGESLAVDKQAGEALPEATPLGDRATMLFSGTAIQRGRAEGIVVATGTATELGRIFGALARPAADPPLTRRLERFTRVLGLASVVLVGLVVALQLLAGAGLRETFFLAIALAISVIPEGLPVAVTVALALATRRMARRNVIVSHLPAVEGLGACTVIATDKTGTLTVNRLTARRAWLPEAGEIDLAEATPPARLSTLARLAQSAALCNDGSLREEDGIWHGTGDAVDVAFLRLAQTIGIDPRALRASEARAAELPYSPDRKFGASLNDRDGALCLHVKGAPEVLLPLCRGIDAAEAMAAADRMAASGCRVLAVATRPADSCDPAGELHDLELLGLVGFIDPLRPEAKASIAACRAAGIRVVMITGDHAATALAIATELGLAEDPGSIVTGAELAALAGDPEAAALALRQAAVFARVEPSQKVLIVEALQAGGDVVAMTGDGVNDAPALRRADLGVAMGRDGTDVARDAADLVLADDNFASIVAGIEEGRGAYANIRKVILLVVSTGAAEVAIFLLALASGLPVPLTAIQLLWLNLVTNGGQDVAMGFERAERGLLRRPPRPAGEPIFDGPMLRQTILSGAVMGGLTFGVFAWLLSHGRSEFEARNMALFLMVAFENVHVFNCRSETLSALRIPLAHNWPLVATVAGAQLVHIAAGFTPGLRDVLQVAPIAPMAWLALAGIALSLLAVMELDKWRARQGRSTSAPSTAPAHSRWRAWLA